MKKIISILCIMMMIIAFAGCAAKEEPNPEQSIEPAKEETKEEKTEDTAKQPVDIHVIAPAGAPLLSMVKMFTENPEIVDYANVTYEHIEATDALSSKLISEEVEMAIVPTNLAANLHNKGVPYKLAASTVWGIFYLVSSEEITGWEDLKGKEISMFGRGLTPDATFRYLLSANGMKPDEDVTFKYFAGSTELAADFISGQSHIALVPEPLLTNILMKREDAKVVMDIQKEWEAATSLPSYPQASLIISNKLIDQYPEVVEAFLEEYEKSIQWINENPVEAGKYYENLGVGLKAPIVEKALERCNIRYMDAATAKESLMAYLEVLHEFNNKIIGGKLPDEGFYMEK